MKYLRALYRAGATVLMAVPLAAVQVLIAAPLFQNYTRIPQIMQRCLRDIFDINLEVKGTVDNSRQLIIAANHLSWMDAPVIGSLYRGAFVAKNDIAKWRGIGYLAKCFRTIFIERTKEYLPYAHEKLVKAMNEGQTIIIFPEGTTTKGADVNMYRAGLLKPIYNEAVDSKGNALHVYRKMMLQPAAIRVLETNGNDARNDQAARDVYCWYGETGFLHHLWNALVSDGIRIEVTILPQLDPEDFSNRFDLINTAHKMVREVVLGRPLPDPEPYKPGVV